MNKKIVILLLLVLTTGLILAFSSDYNSTGLQYGTQAGKGASIGQKIGTEAPAGISNKGNAPGVYDWKQPINNNATSQQTQVIKNAGEIIVTARRMPEDIALVPRSVEVIKAAEIADSGDEKLQDVLDSIAGTIVLRSGGYQGVGSVSFRGAPSNHTLLLLDGVPLNDMMVGGADLNMIDLTNIEKIEIIKGGLSSVYGADAAAGVINVISGSKEAKLLGVSASYGSFNSQKYTVSSDYNIFGIKYSVSAIEEKSDGYTDNSAYLKHILNAKLSFTGDFLDSTIFGYYFNRNMQTPFNGYSVETDAKQQDEDFNIGADEKFTLGMIKGKLSGYMRSARLRFTDPTFSVNSDHKKIEYNGSFYMIYDEGGFFSGVTGYDAGIKEVRSSDIGDTTNTNQASVTNMSIKLFDDKLIMNTGFRADFNSAYKNMTSENISIKYKFPENVDIRISIDKSYTAPTLGNLFWPTQDFGYGYYMKGNANLVPENSTTYEIGLEKKDDKISEGVTFFKSEIENLISWKETTDGVSITYTPINIDKAFLSGIEMKADFKPFEFLAVYARYNFLIAVDQDGMQLPYRPEGMVDAGLNIRMPFDIKVTIDGQYVDIRKDTAGKNLKAYSLLNCMIVHKMSKNIKLFLNIKNVLDDTTYEIVKNYKMPGRTFNAEMEISF
ncbi:MAG: TonB-dependent receptor [bacterium]